MKTLLRVLLALALPVSLYSQSTMEFQSGTNIEVTTGADICADNVLINGTYSGDGTQCGGALPVEMATVSATATGRTVSIKWSTASETNNFGFEVERRFIRGSGFKVQGLQPETLNQKPETQWSTVAFVRGSGTSTAPREYSYTDEKLIPGRYAYRIRQIDNNGSFVYTQATEVDVGLAPKEFTLGQNYPNPFNPTTTIEFTLQEDGHVMLKLYDIAGSEVVTLLDEERKAGYYQSVSFDASRLGSGTYFYRLQANGKVMTKKLLLLK